MNAPTRNAFSVRIESAADRAVSRYVHEPFNWQSHPERKAYGVKYLRAGSREPSFARTLDGSVTRSRWRDRIREFVGGRRLVLKDVHASLAVEFMQERLHAAVVILTRHPCGMASSWLRLDFARSPELLLSQADLVEEHLQPFEAHMRASRDPLFQMGAYWGASYYVLDRLARGHPEWQWVTHEELCVDPRAAFGALLQRLGVDVRCPDTPYFDRHDRPPAPEDHAYRTFRASRSEPEKWRTLLSAPDIARVLRGAEPFGVERLLRRRGSSGAADGGD